MLELPETTKKQINKKEVAKALQDPDTFATVIHAVCLVYYGDEIYDLPSTEIYMRLEEDFLAKPCEEIENKIQAIFLATVTDAYYEDTESFKHITLTLLGGDPSFEVFSQLSLPELFWAAYEVSLSHEEAEFSDRIKTLIHREIDGEAEETFDEEMRPSYVIQALMDYKKQLKLQLKAVGFENFHLPQVSG